MKINLISFVAGVLTFACLIANAQKPKKQERSIFVELRFEYVTGTDSAAIDYTVLEKIPGYSENHHLGVKTKNGVANWRIYTNLPVSINTGAIGKRNRNWLMEPGDSIVIFKKGNRFSFAGRGIEKLKLQERIHVIRDSLQGKLSNLRDIYTESLEDYLQWDHYLKTFYQLLLPLFDSYKTRISSFALNYIRDDIFNSMIDNYSDKFGTFRAWVKRSGKLTSQNVNDIYDSTYVKAIVPGKLPSMSRIYLGSWRPVMYQVLRKYNFNSDAPPLNSELSRHLLYLELGKKTYTGFVREKFLERFLTKEMIDAFGFVPEVEAALTKYYAESGYPAHKAYVREFEKKYRTLQAGKPAPPFALTGLRDRSFTNENFKGKVVLMDFWFTGCVGCIQLTPELRRVEEHFKRDTNLVFLSVSIDEKKSTWEKSVREKKYTTGSAINLYTSGQGKDHPILKNYGIHGYPSLFLIDGAGNVAQNPVPDPRSDRDGLMKLIEKQLTLAKDGPYIFSENGAATIHTINGSGILSRQIDRKNPPSLSVQTDEYSKVFSVALKQIIQNEPSEFAKPEKLMALSDIEGNFDQFRKLLQSNGVIDENYNWIFGKGHLVFCGDMFDRGEQVTECLWLVYALEEKAKSAGGYVHFILGNHEIMNLSGDDRYVREKYKINAQRIGMTYNDLYSTDSELGRWLRTKNIMEKIGDMLFVHGGVSKEVNELPLTISQMNELARPWLDRLSVAQNSNDKALSLLFNSKEGLSPFWYRDYYLEREEKVLVGGSKGIDTIYKTPMTVIDATLKNFGIDRIVTGHTIVHDGNDVGDTVSVHYGGKVLNIDTRHAINRSEALLIEGPSYYRVNTTGERHLLFTEDKKKIKNTN